MNESQRFRLFPSRWMATVFLAGLTTVAVHAQATTQVSDSESGDDVVSNVPATTSTPKLDLATTAGVNYSSSSSSVDEPVDADAAEHFLGADATQPPPRRRYGAPRYNDSSHNSDGSNKWAFMVGVGAAIPIGNTYHYDTAGYGFQVGGGRNFNKKFGVMAQFDYDHFGLEQLTLHNQSELYFNADGQGLDGNSHIWSFSLNPTYNFVQSDTVGAYAVVGVGFYHKVTNFTLPQNECLDEFCQFVGTVNANVDHYTSNAPGFNGGFGLTYKFSRFASERFYLEARYVFMDNSQRQGITVYNENTPFGLAYTGSNGYPANSNRTTYIPVKVGVRF